MMNNNNHTISANRKSTYAALAKLMAGEDIRVFHDSKVKTAYFDVHKRMLCLPNYPFASEELYVMLVAHEIGHALYTPAHEWIAAMDKIREQYNKPEDRKKPQFYQYIMNMIEDVRIDKLVQQAYPGTKRSYSIGSKELFKILDKDVRENDPNFDYNTLGVIERINLYYKSEVHGILKVNFKDNKEIDWLHRTNKCLSFDDVINLTNEIFEELKDSDNLEMTEEEMAMMQGDIIVTVDEKTGEVSAKDKDGNPVEIPKEMLNIFQKVMKKLKAGGNMPPQILDVNPRANVFMDISSIKTTDKVVSFKDVHQELSDFYANIDNADSVATSTLSDFKRINKDVVNHMVSVFQQKKRAQEYNRTQIGKTGIIDMNKVHTFKYADDVFKKMATTPTGKNHGLLMFLDMSGSMSDYMYGTYQQLLTLVMFARKVNIPFEVYGFTDHNSLEKTNQPSDAPHYECNYSIRNYFSSKMGRNQFDIALKNMSLIMAHYNSGVVSIPDTECLGGTPLNHTIALSNTLVRQFYQEHNVDIMNVVFLSDGEATDSLRMNNSSRTVLSGHSENVVVLDKNTRGYWRHNFTEKPMTLTNFLLNLLKDNYNVNIIGFNITDHEEELHNKNGYDRYYNIMSNKMEILEDVQRTGQSFADFVSNKRKKRIILSRFIENIS